MAGERVTLVPDINIGTAASDLRTHQNKFVQVNAAGVTLADVRSMTDTLGTAFVLANAPNTGEPVSATTAPNVAAVKAGVGVTAGYIVQPMSATGLAMAVASVSCGVGVALHSANSGDILSVKLFR